MAAGQEGCFGEVRAPDSEVRLGIPLAGSRAGDHAVDFACVGLKGKVGEMASKKCLQCSLDDSIGWVNRMQVERTLYQDIRNRETCTPDYERNPGAS
jgi:hypothetical protein